jgi:hypothetical protein
VTQQGRGPDRLYRFRCDGTTPDGEEVQARMYEASAGVIDLDHLLVIGRHLGALPDDDVVAIELEPRPGTTGDALSAQAQALLPELVDLVRRESSSQLTHRAPDRGGRPSTPAARPNALSEWSWPSSSHDGGAR